jgi:hypothetical protein
MSAIGSEMGDRLAQHGIRLKSYDVGTRRALCPECSTKRSKAGQRDPCLSVTIDGDGAAWHCWHCGHKGGFRAGNHQDQPKANGHTTNGEHVFAQPDLEGPTGAEALAYLRARGISKEIAIAAHVGADLRSFGGQLRSCVAFPYRAQSGGQIVGIKYRNTDRTAAKNGRVISAKGSHFATLWGADRLDMSISTAVLTEGEMDSLSFGEAGIPNAVSIPSGAMDKPPTGSLDWLEPLKPFELTLALDRDKTGQAMQRAILKQMEPRRCRLLVMPEDCKDANEVLAKHGANALADLHANAKPATAADAEIDPDEWEAEGERDDGPLGPEPPPRPDQDGDTRANDEPPLIVTNPTTLQGMAIPERRWAVEDWVPEPLVTGIYGDGGMGKSLLMQMLMTSTALALPWLGIPIRRMRALAIFCEDPEDELQRRQADINRRYGVDMRDLCDMRWICRHGMDNLLMEFDGNSRRGKPTPFYAQVTAAIDEFKPEILFVDTVADTFGGNENDRQQARFFVQVGLGGWARMIDGAVVASAHPSRAGLRSGDGDSGSTAWNAAFRSRLYLSSPKADATTELPDSNERTLERKKANYAPRSEIITVRWQDGVFVLKDANAPRPSGVVDKIDLDNRVLEEMRAMIAAGGIFPTNYNAPNGFANAIRKRHGWATYHQNVIVASQERLLKCGRASSVPVKTSSRPRECIRPADMLYPGEAKEV